MTAFVLGVAGGSGSGKTSVARRIAEAVRPAAVAVLDMDAYYRNFAHLPMEDRRRVNWDDPDMLDIELFVDHLSRLRRGEAIPKPVYDFVTHTRSSSEVPVAAERVVIVDGIMLFVDERVRALCDLKIFVDTDADVRLARRIRRDISRRGRPLQEILDQYVSTVHPMHQQYVEPSRRHADVIVPHGAHNRVAIDLVAARVREHLGGRT